jgi:hypothetical protein
MPRNSTKNAVQEFHPWSGPKLSVYSLTGLELVSK